MPWGKVRPDALVARYLVGSICHPPMGASDQEWWQVIDAAGRFLDECGPPLSNSAGLLVICLTCRAMASRAASFGSLEAKAFKAIGPRRMVTQDGRVFNRFEN